MGADVFHAGEIAVQERAGVREEAAKVGSRIIGNALDENFVGFLQEMFLLIAASRDPDGRVWASPLLGPRGFVAITAINRLLLRTMPGAGDALLRALHAGPTAIGLIAIDSMSRGRVRVNGFARLADGGIDVVIRETFGNCQKYIQRRHPVALLNDGNVGADATLTTTLDADQRALIRRADTFFVATANAERGADASHRGGTPGFVDLEEHGTRLTFPDYKGNNMFMTLGNLTVDPAIGLLFIDWETGASLQLSGRATIEWDGERLERWPRANRLVDVEIEAVVAREHAIPLQYALVEASRFNPAVPAS